MTTLRITDIGDAGSIVLPPELAKKLQAKAGDEVTVTLTSNGIELINQASRVPGSDLIDEIIAEDDQVLRKLAE